MPAGRPSEFKPEYVEQAKKLCKLGATDIQLADFFEVSETTVNNWKNSHPEFLESLKLGKDEADQRVVSSLYRRALGFEHDAVKIFCSKDGVVTEVPYREIVPPDTTACIFWLKNRQKADWRDKVEAEVTGKDGGPLQTHVTVTFVKTGDENEREQTYGTHTGGTTYRHTD
jgi:hypothetical protein